eukprot:TRINITY_DN16628_c0_g1_i1.p1 TRINITY_DN16628_c0_g1~~TRINITY_DN16628_c0_g1_i1.p1  ORF type:complete len:392 (+),score=25.37 TRINITY_DN16628_c0_g1_i1:41-1216(+)
MPRIYQTARGVFEVPDNYEVKSQLGYGAFGTVCSAKDACGNPVAIKQVLIHANPTSVIRLLREVKLLRFFDHENIVRLHDILPLANRNFSKFYFAMDLMDTDLDIILRSNQPIALDHVQHFTYSILRGLKCIHSAGVIHRDLKPKNILLTQDCTVKICDFGLAREMNDNGLSLYVETRWYRAPEIIMECTQYDQKVDLWSVGCILAELLLRKPLWPGDNSKDQMDRILATLGNPTLDDVQGMGSTQAQSYVTKDSNPGHFDQIFATHDPQAVDLLRKLLTFDPRKRLDVHAALAHPFFEDIRDEEDEPICTQKFDLHLDNQMNHDMEWATLELAKSLLWDEMIAFHPEMKAQQFLMPILTTITKQQQPCALGSKENPIELAPSPTMAMATD